MILFVFFIILFLLAIIAICSDADNWIPAVLLAMSIICLISGVIVMTCKLPTTPVTITTSVPAQIDTVITLNNNVADTIYVYHIIEE